MSELTTNYELKKPTLSDPADITQYNDNWDIIDAELQSIDRVHIVNATSTDGESYTATNEKVILKPGVTIAFIPDKMSTLQAPTLNLNGTGAKKLYQSLLRTSATNVPAKSYHWLERNKPVLFTYDGTQWRTVAARPTSTDIYDVVDDFNDIEEGDSRVLTGGAVHQVVTDLYNSWNYDMNSLRDGTTIVGKATESDTANHATNSDYSKALSINKSSEAYQKYNVSQAPTTIRISASGIYVLDIVSIGDPENTDTNSYFYQTAVIFIPAIDRKTRSTILQENPKNSDGVKFYVDYVPYGYSAGVYYGDLKVQHTSDYDLVFKIVNCVRIGHFNDTYFPDSLG